MFAHHFKQRHLFLLAAAVVAICMQSVRAQVLVKFDENGNGSVQVPGAVPVTLPSLGNIVDPFDPSSGIKPLAYNYAGVLGTTALQGDIILTEPTTSPPPQGISDVIRFMQGLILVYSELPEPLEGVQLADVGIPSLFQPNKINVSETGPEPGLNGMFGYVPTAGQPGLLPASFSSVSYDFVSDPAPVPEPSSLLALLPVGALLLIRRRRPIS
jgi:hypothetical protein